MLDQFVNPRLEDERSETGEHEETMKKMEIEQEQMQDKEEKNNDTERG